MSAGAKPEQCFIEFVVKASCPEDCAVDCLRQCDIFACRVSGSPSSIKGSSFERAVCCFWFFVCLRGFLWGGGFGLVLNNCFR